MGSAKENAVLDGGHESPKTGSDRDRCFITTDRLHRDRKPNNANRDTPSALRVPTAPEMVEVGDVAEVLYQYACLWNDLKIKLSLGCICGSVG